MKKNMKKVLFIILMLLCNLQIVQTTTYYENHIDWSTYCMRAKNINITQTEYEKMKLSKVIPQELTNRSFIAIKSGKANEEFENWQVYSGTLYVDISQLLDIEKVEHKVSRTIIFYMNKEDQTKNYLGVVVTITPDKETSEEENILPEEGKKPTKPNVVEGENSDKDTVKDTEETISKVKIEKNKASSKENHKIKEKNMSFLEWIFSGERIPIKIPIIKGFIYMTPLAIMQANISGILMIFIFLVSLADFRMLMKYKKDKEKYICSRYK